MEIESITHKQLRRFVETGNAKGVIEADRVFRMVNFIIDAADVADLATPPNYGFHPLTGDRVGTYAMTVTRNWRLTFGIDAEGRITDLDLEDYH